MKPSLAPIAPAGWPASSSAAAARTESPAGPVYGIENVAACLHLHQIPRQHLEICASLAQTENIVFGIRPSTRGSARYKLAGNATKPLEVSGPKTCDSGIAMGLICVDQRRSKNRDGWTAVAAANRKVAELVGNPASGIVAAQLMLSEDDLRYLIEENEIRVTGGRLGGPGIALQSRASDGSETVFATRKAGGYEISHDSGNLQPLQVLSDLGAGASSRMCAQLTADDDLLLVAIPYDQFDGDAMPKESKTVSDFHAHLAREMPSFAAQPLDNENQERMRNFSFGASNASAGVANWPPAESGSVDPSFAFPGAAAEPRRSSAGIFEGRRMSVANMRGGQPYSPPRRSSAGLVSKRELALIDTLNAKLAGAGPKLFHHGADNNNLKGHDPEANKNSVIFLPEKILGHTVLMAQDMAQINSVLASAKNAKYMSHADAWGQRRGSSNASWFKELRLKAAGSAGLP